MSGLHLEHIHDNHPLSLAQLSYLTQLSYPALPITHPRGHMARRKPRHSLPRAQWLLQSLLQACHPFLHPSKPLLLSPLHPGIHHLIFQTSPVSHQAVNPDSALYNYTDKFHILKLPLAEHDGLKHNVSLINVFMEGCQNCWVLTLFQNPVQTPLHTPLKFLANSNQSLPPVSDLDFVILSLCFLPQTL